MLQTQHGNFFNKARRNDAVGELDDNNEKIYNDLNDKNK